MSRFERIHTEQYENKLHTYLEGKLHGLANRLSQIGYNVQLIGAPDGTFKAILSTAQSGNVGEVYSVGWGCNGIIGYVYEGQTNVF